MVWMIWIACSAMEKSAANEGSWSFDSGMNDAYDTAVNSSEEDLDSSVNPSWVKISIDLNIEEYGQASLYRDLYAEDMTWICQQELVFQDVLTGVSPVTELESWWTLSNPIVLNDNCNISREESPFYIGVGSLLEDVAVASEVTHWLDREQEPQTDDVWGAYTQSPDASAIWAFGVAYKLSETEWKIRTVYSLPWD